MFESIINQDMRKNVLGDGGIIDITKQAKIEKTVDRLWKLKYLKLREAYTKALFEEVYANQEIENNQDDTEMQIELIKEYERLQAIRLLLEKQLDNHVMSKVFSD